MKVLMTADAVGGVWTYALELTAALARHDTHVVLACMGPHPSAEQLRRAARLANLTVHCAEYKLEWMHQPWADVERAAHWLRELCELERPALLHLNGYAHAAYPWPCPVLVVAHSCVWSWWRAVHGCEPPADWGTYRARVACGLQSANAVVAPTAAFLAEIRLQYAPTKPCSVIYNGRRQPRRSCESKRLPLIFAAGRVWDRAKNLSVLDTVARSVPWRIVVAGSTVATDGSSTAPRFLECLGSLSPTEMAGWLRQASIFVHPALYEPFGLAVLEAAAAGCALVLADIPTLRELWDGAATFVDPRDASALQAALHSLIAAPSTIAEQASTAQQRAQDFTSTRMAEGYAALYGQILDPPCGTHLERSAAA